jgi:uncharacterized membrane protein
MNTDNTYKEAPSFGRSFGNGMQVLGDNFLSLLLVVFILMMVQGPVQIVRVSIEIGGFNLAVAIFALFALVYSTLVIPVFTYGADIMFVHAVRKQKLDFSWVVKGFTRNYLNIVLSSLLVFALVFIGIIFLIIPGIIIGCRLVFVSRLVMDKNLDPIAAIEESWRISKNYGWTIFAMGFVSIFIMILGFVLLIIGLFPATIWITSAFSVLYQDILEELGEAPPAITE